ncbi:Uncharacterised protein [Nocardia otitidiscaviarum]|uniref:Uncharacterized protein n=1 Tax=Nocardia otitidiscaviarum TaxID=1823 RepID=A0A379JLY2_9NOCA|nr:Uncharacterised protein [Nocardia otitidiscaviarum]
MTAMTLMSDAAACGGGRARVGTTHYVLRLVTAKTKLRGAVAEECDDALAFVSMGPSI